MRGRVSNRGLAVLWLAIFLVMMGFGIVLPVLQFYARDVGATPFEIGLLATSYAFMQFLFAPVGGGSATASVASPSFP